jgi:hypothetical protein
MAKTAQAATAEIQLKMSFKIWQKSGNDLET